MDRSHDMRSASKTVTALMAGQVFATSEITPETSVYDFLNQETPEDENQTYRDGLQVEHLLSMSSGFSCDDNDSNSPGQEDFMQEQTHQLDWWQFALDLPMVQQPGTKGAYCTAGINLVGNAISLAADSSVQTFFKTNLATPLGIDRYFMNLDPLGRGYSGGGLRMRPRDFLKLGQLLVDGGRWQGDQIVPEKWIGEMQQSHASIYEEGDYGYGLWISSLPFKGQQIPIYSATGNGGQMLIAIPSLELVVGFTGGNYGNFPTWIKWRERLVPDYILRAVQAK